MIAATLPEIGVIGNFGTIRLIAAYFLIVHDGNVDYYGGAVVNHRALALPTAAAYARSAT